MENLDLSSFQLGAPDAATANYLESFNIDVGSAEDEQNTPHYIINLNVYNSNCLSASDGLSLDGLAPVPISGPLPSTSSRLLDTSTTSEKSDTSSPTPLANTQAHLRPMGPSRGRGRGRQSFVPLDDVMERKIMTFEGRDCAQHLAEFQRMFPRFKRAYINRVFTSNMLDYEKTYHQLNEEHKLEDAKYANVRLIHSSKQEKRNSGPKPKPDLAPLSPQSLLYLELPLGKCPPHIANTLYRRVIVNPDGTVESAEERENRFLNVNGMKSRRPVMLLPPPKMARELPVRLPPPSGLQVRSPSSLSPRYPPPTPQSFDTQRPITPKVIPVSQPTSSPETPTSRPSGNRFFRTNRVCEAEIKKRGYVDRELRSTKLTGSTNAKRPRSGIQRDTADSSVAISDSKEGDAVQYMASVGVVSTPTAKKRINKPKSAAQSSDDPDEAMLKSEDSADDGLNLSNEERKSILEFFNQARPEELSLMPGCSRKTAEVLISLRPFQNTCNLIARLTGTRYLSPGMIDACKEVLQMRSTVIRLLQRCERITERVTAHASRLLANNVSLCLDQSTSVRDDKPEQLLTQQPAILNPLRELKPYQLVGLNWLRLLHHEQVNGILADEMGLGKTIQAIAFLASLWESGDRGPHLIICPSSTQDNWQRELSDWCSHLKVLVYQGSAEQRKAIRLKIYDAGTQLDFNILLTSYAIGTSTIEDRALMKRINFHYGIFDEAHMLKNMSSQRFRHLSNFRVQRRLLLTGTPLQNNLLELISLLSFLMPDMFSRSTDLLKKMFQIYSKPVNRADEPTVADSAIEKSNFELERLEQAKNLLQPFLLRRLKSQVLSQLPTKTTEVIRVPMTESQAKHYWNLVERLRQVAKKANIKNPTTPEKSHVGDKNVEPCVDSEIVNGTESVETRKTLRTGDDSPSNMIVQLRKAANHQSLLSRIAYSELSLKDIAETLHLDPSHSNSDPQLIFEDLLMLSDHQVHKICQFYDILSSYTLPIEAIMSGSGKLAWLDEHLPRLIKEGHRLLIFSQFVIILDIVEEFLRSRDRRYLRLDGSTPVADRQELVDRFNSSSIEVFLLSTRAGGLGLNLTGADTVIIHDIDFNPYNDRQAEDRVHRLGQTRPVHVIRLVSKDTVEEGMLRIATEKLQLEQGVTGASLLSADEQEMEEEEAEPGEANEMNGEDELTESTAVVMKIMGSSSQHSNKCGPLSRSSRSYRFTDREFWALLEDALKPVS